MTTTTSPRIAPEQAVAAEIISASGLVKRYGDFTAVDGVTFDVHRGECFGLLGPNGAGKTTTIRMITCVSPVSGGELLVDGMPVQDAPREIKSLLGVIPQESNLDAELSVRQNLRVYARYFDLPSREAERRIDEVLNFFQLNDKQNARIDELSGGLKRRLVIARGLINNPKILVLDEPTTGLDPQAKHMVWQKLRQLRTRGVTMLLTTHYMDEAEHLCDRIVIMDHGRIIAEGSPRPLIEEHVGEDVIEVHLGAQDPASAMDRLMRYADLRIERFDDILYVYKPADSEFDPRTIEDFTDRLVYRKANLEDVFLKLTGRALAD
ncbi:MAG TPA: ATP-binding cassette domain-containing protein [Dehalococcoidia bacterium]|nr:ATP-binding cassette domain-containing protein [Dehalococcoidia bacterium]